MYGACSYDKAARHTIDGIEVKPGDILLHDTHGLMQIDGLTYVGIYDDLPCLQCRKVGWVPGERGYLEAITDFTWPMETNMSEQMVKI